MKSQKVLRALRRELIRAQANEKTRHTSLLELVVGHDSYVKYLNMIRDEAIEAYNSAPVYNPDSKRAMTYQEAYLLDEAKFNSDYSNQINPNTLREYTWDEWKALYEQKFIMSHLTTVISPTSLYHSIETQIESKKM